MATKIDMRGCADATVQTPTQLGCPPVSMYGLPWFCPVCRINLFENPDARVTGTRLDLLSLTGCVEVSCNCGAVLQTIGI